MKIEILESRYIVGIGYKEKGQIIDCDDNMAHSLIIQGIAAKKKEKLGKHTEGVKEE